MKIKSVRELALALNKGPVAMQDISKALYNKIELWLKRKEVIESNGFIILQ